MGDKDIHWPSVGQFAFSVLVIFFLWGGALVLAIWGMIELGFQNQSISDPLPIILMATASATGGLLMLPSAFYALWRLLGWSRLDSRFILRRLGLHWWILALPLIVLLGRFVASRPVIAWLGLPILHPLAIGIPTIWLLFLAVRRLPLGSSQRMWGVFGSGLTLGPFLISIFESLAALGFLLMIAIYISSQPELLNKLLQLSPQLQQSQSPEKLIEAIKPLLFRPAVLLTALLFGAVAVPLIEEAIKPIGVWLLVGRKLKPSAGFAAGALSGAGYALIESLVLSSNGQDWSALVLARIGTSAVHIFTTSLTGWALALAWQRKRYLQLFLAYTCAVLIHGIWNGLTLLYSFNLLASMEKAPFFGTFAYSIGSTAPMVLVLLAIGCTLGLILANRMMTHPTPRGKVHLVESPVQRYPDESVL